MLMRMRMTFLAEFVAPSPEKVIGIGIGNAVPDVTPMRLGGADMVGIVKALLNGVPRTYPDGNRGLLLYRMIGMMTMMIGFKVSN
jgi:hypothetical protein